MNILSQLVEICATFTECVLVLSAIMATSKKRYKGWKNNILLIAFSVCSTTLINILNSLDIFFYITPIISMVFINVLTILLLLFLRIP